MNDEGECHFGLLLMSVLSPLVFVGNETLERELAIHNNEDSMAMLLLSLEDDADKHRRDLRMDFQDASCKLAGDIEEASNFRRRIVAQSDL